KAKWRLWSLVGAAVVVAALAAVWFLVIRKTAGTVSNPAPPHGNIVPPYVAGLKDRVTLPPEISAFIDRMEKQAGEIAEKGHLTLSAEVKSFFAAARAGRVREAGQTYWSWRHA